MNKADFKINKWQIPNRNSNVREIMQEHAGWPSLSFVHLCKAGRQEKMRGNIGKEIREGKWKEMGRSNWGRKETNNMGFLLTTKSPDLLTVGQ